MEVKILATDLKFPEGPVVMNNGRIFFVELLGGTITEYHRNSKDISRINTYGAPNGMLVDDDSTLVFCDSKQNAIRTLNIKTQTFTTLVDTINGEPLRAPNDLIKDKFGNILFTCPGGSQDKPIGYMCALTPEKKISIIAKDMYFPNGLLFINDEQQIIINETWKHRLIIGHWNPSKLKIEHIKEFYAIGGNAEPDGLTLSHDNKVYAAVYGTSMIWVFNTEGDLLEQISLPGKNPTNLYFDHVGDLGLIVTEAEKGLLLSIK